MSKPARSCVAVVLAALSLVVIAGDTIANRADGSLRGTFYFSPSWGYSVRWFTDEWSVADESSQDRADVLVLQSADGATIRFEGRAAYQGDTRACLDDQIAALEADGAQDIAVLQDDTQRPQKIYHPWRSWMLLIASMPQDSGAADQAIYLDCRMLLMGDAVLIRELRMPAARFASDLAELDVLNAALPRDAWIGSSEYPLAAPGVEFGLTDPPLPVDSLGPREFPEAPKVFSGPDGELGMITVVDGAANSQDYVVVIENSGAAPLVIDPAQFLVTNSLLAPQVDPNVAALSATWTDGATPGVRTIAPGEQASLLLQFPPPSETANAMLLTFWDATVRDGGIIVTCVSQCGYGGGGSRPRVRAMR